MAISQNLNLEYGGIFVETSVRGFIFTWTSAQTGESRNESTRSAKYYISINDGAEQEHSVEYTLPQNTTVTIAKYAFFANPRPDGSCTVKIRTWMDTGTEAGILEKELTKTFAPEVFDPEISSAKDLTLGENCSVTWTPLSDILQYKLKFSLGSWSHTTDFIELRTTSAYTYTDTKIPLEVANQLPSSASGKMTIALATYSKTDDPKQIGSDHSAEITVTVPNNKDTQPSVSLSVSPSTDYNAELNGLYIQGRTQAHVSLGAEAKFGATIVSKSLEIVGIESYSNISYANQTFGPFNRSGKLTIKVTAKDSRGFYGTNYKEIDVIPYSRPYVCAKSGESAVIAARCDASANFTDSGTYLKIKAKIAYTKIVVNGVQKNYGLISFRYRKEGGAYSDWYQILRCEETGSDEVITPPIRYVSLETSCNYHVQIVASDGIYDSAPVTIVIPSESVYMDRPAGGQSMALGGYSTGDRRHDVYWNLIARGGLSIPDKSGDLIPLDSTLPVPYGQLKAGYDPNSLSCGIHVVANNIALKQGDTVIMYNGVIIQMEGQLGGNVKIQLALPLDENRNPMYRICWYSNWTNWRSMKL